MLAASDVATSPRDAIQRKRMVVAYNRRQPNTQMDRREGYTIIQPGALPGSELVIRLAQELFEEKIVDLIISEPPGGAHTDYDQAARLLDSALSGRLAEAVSCTQEERLARRHSKLRQFGRWGTA